MRTDIHCEPIRLFDKLCGPGYMPLIVAELSGNHGGKLENALRMIDAATEAGADAIKIQTYRPDTITLDHDGPEFIIESGLWKGRTLYDLYQEAHTPWEWHAALFARAREKGVPLFSSPFDTTAVDLLESLGCPAYKIASYELVDIRLIQCVASTGKPVIMSTGMATLEDIDEAVAAVRQYPNTPFVILHCTSAYPAPVSGADLKTIPMLVERYHAPVGLSDHTTGIVVPVAAVALGANFVEKHFTLDRGDGAVDSAFSLEPAEFKAMADNCRAAWQSLGNERTGPGQAEMAGRAHRRSLYIVKDVKKGEYFTRDNVKSVRPANGLHTRELPNVLGRCASRDIERGTPACLDMIA